MKADELRQWVARHVGDPCEEPVIGTFILKKTKDGRIHIDALKNGVRHQLYMDPDILGDRLEMREWMADKTEWMTNGMEGRRNG